MRRLTTFTALLLLSSCVSSGPEEYGAAIRFVDFSSDATMRCVPDDKIRGVTVGIIEENRLPVAGYGSPECAWALEEIQDLGADWVTITPYVSMMSCDDTKIVPYFEFPRERMEEMVVGAVRQAREMGLKVFLVPHVYPWDWCWRGDLRPGGGPLGTEEGWNAWFDSYGAYMRGLAETAAREGVEMLSIGVEFKSGTERHGYLVSGLAQDLRTVYPGLLTYCANWDEAEDVSFWEDLDYIGINAFYPMSTTDKETQEEAVAMMRSITEDLERISRTHQKPILFTEVGFKALKGSLKEPWIWPEYVEAPVVDDNLQAMAFDVTFQALWDKPWFAGLFVWRYMSDPSDYSQEAPYGYPPRLKPAEKVIESWLRCGL